MVASLIMGAPPLFSVITIVKNDRAGLQATLDSVRAQRFTDFEHVIVDGASTDGSADVARRSASTHVSVVSEPDSGISEAFNKGIARARGAWLNFLNAGDVFLHADVLARVAARAAGPAAIVTGYSVTRGVQAPPYPVRNGDRLARRACLSHQASFIHRRVFEACGTFDTRFQVRMDYEFWLRALPRFSFDFIDEPLVVFAPGGVSTRARSAFFAEEFAANRLHLRLPGLANLRVRVRERAHQGLRTLGLFERYRALRLPVR
ncbi:MAG TPA: glycosyltransferase family 2 protein [Polyangia bacterium]|jgi:glycosyltransferase involved in cell wall biosynthesis|nr:glycosyltransferase family 2 protein [Polyangia bacterium]